MLNFEIYFGIIPCEIQTLISERQRRIDTSRRSLPPKRANKFARAFRASVHPSCSLRPISRRFRAAHLVLSSPMRFAGAAAYPLLLRSPTEHVLSRVQNVLAICFPRSFGPLPSLSSSLSLPLRSLRSSAPGFFPFTSRHLPPLIPLSSREDARVNTCARAMGEKEHG